MKLRHPVLAAAAVALAAPAAVLAAGPGNSPAPSASAPTARAATAPTVALRSTRYGKILVVGATGRTLYLYDRDARNKSNCSGQCASAWPPLLTRARPTAGAGASASKLGEIKRGANHQVTYADHPLYTFVSDSGPGSITGEGSGGFYVVGASGGAIK